jgi:hypothetical protein
MLEPGNLMELIFQPSLWVWQEYTQRLKRSLSSGSTRGHI